MGGTGYSPGEILRETFQQIRAILGNGLDALRVEKTVVGLFFTGVRLDNGAGGLCFTPIKSIPQAVCCPSSARAMPNSGKLTNRPVMEFMDDLFSGNPLKKAMGIAVINALSEVCWKQKEPEDYDIISDRDALDEIVIPDDAYVAVVGALVPALKILKRRGKPFSVLELDPSTLKPGEMDYYVPYLMAHEKIPQADLLIITGTTLINDSLEALLGLRKPGARVVVVGPTASMLPDSFFRRGVNVLGGVRVTDADRVLDILGEAGSGYHFFRNGAERIIIQSPQK